MNKMILVIDEVLKQELLSKGFEILKEESYGTVFALNKSLQFNFENVDKDKYKPINKLNF